MDSNHPESKSVLSTEQLEAQIDNLTEPMTVDWTNPELIKFLKSAEEAGNAPLNYLGHQLIMYPNGQKLQLFNLSTNQKNSLSIPYKGNLVDFFVTADKQVVAVTSEGVKIWELDKERKNEIRLKLKTTIELPPELTTLFEGDIRDRFQQPFSIQMFPDGKHIGILFGHSDFFLVNCEQGNCIKYEFNAFISKSQKLNPFSYGFVPISDTEIYVKLTPPNSDPYHPRWYKVKLDSARKTVDVDPATLDEHPGANSFELVGDNYRFYSIGSFLFWSNLNRAGIQTIHVSKKGDLSHSSGNISHSFHCLSATQPYYLQKTQTLCVPEINGPLHLLTEENKSDHPTQTMLIDKRIGNGTKFLIPCDDQAVLIWDRATDKLQVCILPALPAVLKQKEQEKQALKEVMDLLEPASVGDLTGKRIDGITIGYKNELVCPFLTSNNAEGVVFSNPTTFVPTQFERPDFSKLATLNDIAACLDLLEPQVRKSNLGLLGDSIEQEKLMAYYFQGPMHFLKRFFHNLSDEDNCKKFYENDENNDPFANPNLLFSKEGLKKEYNDDNLFHDTNNFKQDILKIIHEEFLKQRPNSYQIEVIIPEILKLLQLDKLLDKAQEMVMKMVPSQSQVAAAADHKTEEPAKNTNQGNLEEESEEQRKLREAKEIALAAQARQQPGLTAFGKPASEGTQPTSPEQRAPGNDKKHTI